MYAVPWCIERARISSVCVVDAETPPPHVAGLPVHASLETAKQKVGVFKLRQGEETWKQRVAALAPHDGHSRAPPPCSRAYYKMVEIIRTCILPAPTESLHMCEAPGGFVQAVLDEFGAVRRASAFSLRGPGTLAFANVVRADPRVRIVEPAHRGDIHDGRVRAELCQTIGAGSMHLVTGDAAGDMDNDHANIEAASATLLLCQIEVAAAVQAAGGSLVLKIFGASQPVTLQIIAILTNMYAEVAIIKPHSSRAVNDERYVVCTKFERAIALHLPPAMRPFVHAACTVSNEWSAALLRISAVEAQKQIRAIEQALKTRQTNIEVAVASFK